MSYFGGKTGYREGGTRGGQDRFKWDDVKQDKYRENYLGHSVKAPTGRWQKNKDLFWYDKTTGRQLTEGEARQREIDEIKQRDQDLINEALGLAPKRLLVVESQLDANEVKTLLAKGTAERDRLDVERVEGLGAAPAARHEHIERKSVVEREIERMKKAKEEGTSFKYDDQGAREHPEEEGEGAGEGDKKLSKKDKKRMKKEKKKEKKRLKKERKHKDKEEGRSKGGEGQKEASKPKAIEGAKRPDSPSSASSASSAPSSPEAGHKRRRRLSSASPPPVREEGGRSRGQRPGRSDSQEPRRRVGSPEKRGAERGGGRAGRNRSRSRSRGRRDDSRDRARGGGGQARGRSRSRSRSADRRRRRRLDSE